MKLHGRAATCPRCRILIVRRVLSGRSIASTAREFDVSTPTVRKWLRRYRQAGLVGLTDRSCRPLNSPTRKLEPGPNLNDAIMEIVHSPPTSAGINRTSWRLQDIKNVLEARGLVAGDRSIRTAVQTSGLRWKKARVSLTSHDPEYRAKVDAIKSVLASLSDDETFFSIDELGPVAVKMRGGRALQRSDVVRSVPQWQRSRGFFILTAALDLARNQVAAFFSERKNAEEIIRLIELLRELYAEYRRIYLSWDAAPWHRAERLMEYVDTTNTRAVQGDGPAVTILELPTSAQFLNVIESVFSGLARGVLHNSAGFPRWGPADFPSWGPP
jgi:transposase